MVHEERVGQIADVRVGRVEMPFAEGKEAFLNRQYFRDQFRAGQRGTTGIRIAAKTMPEPKEATIERERLLAEAFRRGRGGQVERTEHVARHVRPAELALADDICQIRGQPVTPQDAGKRLAQHHLQHVRAAGHGNAIDHKRAGHERPEPPFVAVGPVSRLIGIDDGFVRQRRFEFGIRRRDGRAGFFPRVLGTAQTDRHLQRACEKALHDEPWQAAHDRQIRNQGGQLRPELGRLFVRQRGHGDRAAVRTPAAMAAVLGDVRCDRRQLRHLMPARSPAVWRACKRRAQWRHASGARSTIVSTRSTGANSRWRPGWPGWPPALRRLFSRRPRARW